MNSAKTKVSLILPLLLIAFGFTLFMTMGFAPAATAVSSSCPVVWSMPSGSYAPGNTVTATITVPCAGPVSWSIVGPGGVLVASGGFLCTSSSCVSPYTLFTYTAGSSPLTPGLYQVTATWNGGPAWKFGFTVEDFLVTNEVPLGAMAVVAVSLVGLLAVRRLGRSFSSAIPAA